MDIASLNAFLAVAELESFSLAGQRLHLTQPAVSKRIALLEQQLNAKLFDRIGRHFVITEAGKALLPRAKTILQAVEDSTNEIANLAGKIDGPLRVGTSHHIGLHRLPTILSTFTRTFPRVDLKLEFQSSEDVCAQTLAGELDLGVITLPLAKDPTLHTIPLWEDPLQVVVGDRFTEQRSFTINQLADLPAILPERGTTTREIIEHAFHVNGCTINTAISTNYLETIKMLISVGMGWGVLPSIMISQEVKKIVVKGLVTKRTLGVVYNRKRTLPNAANAMLDLLQATQ